MQRCRWDVFRHLYQILTPIIFKIRDILPIRKYCSINVSGFAKLLNSARPLTKSCRADHVSISWISKTGDNWPMQQPAATRTWFAMKPTKMPTSRIVNADRDWRGTRSPWKLYPPWWYARTQGSDSFIQDGESPLQKGFQLLWAHPGNARICTYKVVFGRVAPKFPPRQLKERVVTCLLIQSLIIECRAAITSIPVADDFARSPKALLKTNKPSHFGEVWLKDHWRV